jgi:hypothetical protein
MSPWYAERSRAFWRRTFGLFLLAGAGSGLDSLAEELEPGPDKSQYTLLNPTPEKYLRPMSPDRPDKTDTPFTVDAGHFQLEMDFANLTLNDPNSRRGQLRETTCEIAPVTLKLGVLNNLDVELAFTSFRSVAVEDVLAGRTHHESGFAGLTPRCKINLIGNDGGFVAVGMIPFLTVPVGDRQLTGDSVEGGLGVPVAFDLPGWDVGYQLTVECNRDSGGRGNHAEVANSVTVGHGLIGKLGAAAEFYANVSGETGAGWVGTVDIFLTYQVNENLRFDGGVNIGVSPDADDLHFWTGVTWRY